MTKYRLINEAAALFWFLTALSLAFCRLKQPPMTQEEPRTPVGPPVGPPEPADHADR